MTHKAREKAILDFDKDLEMKIMIASLGCGGIGCKPGFSTSEARNEAYSAVVNLTMASKVICIDLWFNSCMEQQGKSRWSRYMEIC